MRRFFEALEAVAVAGKPDAARQWVYVPYDQLTDALGPLSRAPAADLGVVLVETTDKGRRRPYHKQKLAILLTNQRHFALEQAARGVAVRYLVGSKSYAALLGEFITEVGPLVAMTPAERELRNELAPLVAAGRLTLSAHEGWLTTPEDFAGARLKDGSGWRMDAFYRRVRQRTGVLMDERNKPVGGRYSFDGDNRKRWTAGKDPAPPAVPTFEPDAITQEVCELVAEHFADHPGRLTPSALPASAADAERLWAWAQRECMTHFGAYEDAMSTQHGTLFHTLISSLMNLHRLVPARVLSDVLALNIPLNSQEGFVRQLIGWREYVKHVHDATDGLRVLPGAGGDGPAGDESTSRAQHLNATVDLPAAFWGTPSGLACLDHVVAEVVDDGYTHHINRLMVLANWSTLLGVDPEQLNHWFWVMFTDAYDWVVEPNVLGMGTFGVGPVMTTKPYVSGSAYINKMGDYCQSCAFHPKKTCPMTSLYWDFLARNEPTLRGNQRMKLVMASLRKRSEDKRATDQATANQVRNTLANGERLTVTSPAQSKLF